MSLTGTLASKLRWPKPEKRKKAKKPLQRSGPIKRKSARRIAKQTAEERSFMAWLHKQECCAKGIRFVMGPYTETHWCFAGQYEGEEPVQAAHFPSPRGRKRAVFGIDCDHALRASRKGSA